MDKRFWAILGVIAAIVIGVIIFKGGDESGNSNTGGNATPTNHVIGTSAKGIRLVEVGDYECPYCGVFYPTVKEVLKKYEGQVEFQFRNYPLQSHQNARTAARAAEAADMQGKFWEMNDMLYMQQSAWANSKNAKAMFEGYAQSLGLNVEQFKKDFASSEVNARINADMREFEKLKLRLATPTFLLDGKQIQPDNSVESFSKIIDEAIAKKQ